MSAQTITLTVSDVAARHNLKPEKGKDGVEFSGANPYEPGAQSRRFYLFGDGPYKGSAWDAKINRTYTSKQIAQFEGVPYEQYEGSESDPHLSKGGDKLPAQDFDTRSLEERGLSIEAARFFQIGRSNLNGDWGETRTFPAMHPDGRPGRKRRKFRYPERQLTTHPDKKPRKTDWEPKSKPLGEPKAYNLNNVKIGDRVVLVNAELAVWLFWQEGLTAICPFGETKKEETFTEIVKILQEKGAKSLLVLLDNDSAGRGGSVMCYKACQLLDFPCLVVDQTTAPKDGFDASDLWEFWNNQRKADPQSVPEKFADLVAQQPLAVMETLEIWERLHEAEKTERGRRASSGKIDELGRIVGKAEEEDGVQESQATKLYNLLNVNQMFWTDDGGRCIVINENGRKITYDILSNDFEEYVRMRWLIKTGHVPKAEHVSGCMKQLAAHAKWYGPELQSYVRSGHFGEKIYIDLLNKAGEVVEVDENGWRITNEYPIFFRRGDGIQELPRPEVPPWGDHKETWRRFKEIINYGDEANWIMIVSWMITALVPAWFDAPILSVHGEQGSAKSWLCRLVRQTLDPNKGFMVQAIKDEKDVVIAAEKGRIFALDNQEVIEKWLSNLMASMVSGVPYTCRTLFTDNAQKIFTGQPAIILNGIPEKMGGIDLNDRAIKVFIPRLAGKGYKTQKQINRIWEPLRPYLLAAVLDAMSAGLRNKDRGPEILDGRELPRMADFVEWVAKCGEHLPFSFNDFYNTYTENITVSATGDLGTLFAECIITFVENQEGKYFKGTAKTALELLTDIAAQSLVDPTEWERLEKATHIDYGVRSGAKARLLNEAHKELKRLKGFPNNPAAFGTQLVKLAPSLRKSAHINCEKIGHSVEGNIWEFRKLDPKAVPVAAPVIEDETPAPAPDLFAEAGEPIDAGATEIEDDPFGLDDENE